MAKGQQKSNREVRKPKAEKAKPPASQTSPFAAGKNLGKPKSGGGKK
ncbi:MAG: hypothetical protein ABL898_15515 [Hyphomicrobiaceae bacterium]